MLPTLCARLSARTICSRTAPLCTPCTSASPHWQIGHAVHLYSSSVSSPVFRCRVLHGVVGFCPLRSETKSGLVRLDSTVPIENVTRSRACLNSPSLPHSVCSILPLGLGGVWQVWTEGWKSCGSLHLSLGADAALLMDKRSLDFGGSVVREQGYPC